MFSYTCTNIRETIVSEYTDTNEHIHFLTLQKIISEQGNGWIISVIREYKCKQIVLWEFWSLTSSTLFMCFTYDQIKDKLNT